MRARRREGPAPGLWLANGNRTDMCWAYDIATTMTIWCPTATTTCVRYMLRYLRPTREGDTPGVMDSAHVLADVNFASTNSASHRESTSLFEGNLVTRKPRRQSIVTTSTLELVLMEAPSGNKCCTAAGGKEPERVAGRPRTRQHCGCPHGLRKRRCRGARDTHLRQKAPTASTCRSQCGTIRSARRWHGKGSRVSLIRSLLRHTSLCV